MTAVPGAVQRLAAHEEERRAATEPPSGPPDLRVLQGYRRAAPAFPLDLLGRWAPWVEAASEGSGAPVDYVAFGLLGASAGCAGAVRVSPWPGWCEPVILWLGLVGDPSSGKSPALDPIRQALAAVEAELREPWKDEHDAWCRAAAVAKARRAGWEKAVAAAVKSGKSVPEPPEDDIGPEPAMPRVVVSDATPEALAAVVAGNPRGVLLFRDELAAWLGGFGRYAGGSSGDGERAFWLEAYGGRSHVIDRKREGVIEVKALTVSILGTTQPERLDRLLLAGDNDGLAARFLWAWPEPLPPRRPRACADVSALAEALLWLRRLPMVGEAWPTVHLTEPAVDIFCEWRIENAKAIEARGGMLRSALGKAAGFVLRLAGLLAMLDAAGGDVPRVVPPRTLLRSIALWESYLAPMTERVLGDAALPQRDRDAATLARWLAKTRPDTVNARELRRGVRLPGLTTAERVRGAIDALVEAGWLEPAPERAGETPGRPRADYRVRPEVWTALDAAGGVV